MNIYKGVVSINILDVYNEIEFDLLITYTIAILMMFLGVRENVETKQYEKLNVLLMFVLLYVVLTFYGSALSILLFVIFWFISGLVYLQSSDITLEKELNMVEILIYCSMYWIFKIKSYYIFITLIFIVIVGNIIYLNNVVISMILLFTYLIYFIQNTRDYFGIKKWDCVKQDLEKVKDLKITADIEQLIVFMIYAEDQNFFKRKAFYFNIKEFISGLINIINRNSGFVNSIRPKRNFKRTWKKYKRGYSTIEQQIIRQTFMVDNSYQYTIRRKIFIEYILNIMFNRSLITLNRRRLKGLSKKESKQRLKISLKYNYISSLLQRNNRRTKRA